MLFNVTGRALRHLGRSHASLAVCRSVSTVVAPSLRAKWNLPPATLRRQMVMVTQAKATELPSISLSEESSEGAPDNSYTYLTEELKVTASCLNRVEKLLQQRQNTDEEQSFLRVYVDAGGCSGFQYKFEVDGEFDDEEDIVVVATQSNEPRIVTDEASLGFLKGATLDFVQEMIKSSFAIIENPQSESACGCGSSFAVKNFAANPALD